MLCAVFAIILSIPCSGTHIPWRHNSTYVLDLRCVPTGMHTRNHDFGKEQKDAQSIFVMLPIPIRVWIKSCDRQTTKVSRLKIS